MNNPRARKPYDGSPALGPSYGLEQRRKAKKKRWLPLSLLIAILIFTNMVTYLYVTERRTARYEAQTVRTAELKYKETVAELHKVQEELVDSANNHRRSMNVILRERDEKIAYANELENKAEEAKLEIERLRLDVSNRELRLKEADEMLSVKSKEFERLKKELNRVRSTQEKIDSVVSELGNLSDDGDPDNQSILDKSLTYLRLTQSKGIKCSWLALSGPNGVGQNAEFFALPTLWQDLKERTQRACRVDGSCDEIFFDDEISLRISNPGGVLLRAGPDTRTEEIGRLDFNDTTLSKRFVWSSGDGIGRVWAKVCISGKTQ